MKKTNDKPDLAINGAKPAFEETLHVGRPNIGSIDEFKKYVDQIFESKWLTNNGSLVQELEEKIAKYHNVKNCVAMCNGTVALEIAIRALELKGEVIIPSYTFIATAHALHWQEITPVFADIDPKTHCLDPDSVRRMITPKTTGIIGVHLWGNPSPVDELTDIAAQHNLKLMFDAAHAFGCSYKGTMIGNFGEAEVMSFHATKFFNTFEGGAVLTNNDELAEKMRLMRNFGFEGVDNVIHPGTNGKMTEICAAMGLVNFRHVNNTIQSNKNNYLQYYEELKDLDNIYIQSPIEKQHTNYQYVVIEISDDCHICRDTIVECLHSEKILARKYFWPGCHAMSPYKTLYPHSKLLLGETIKLASKVIVLPTGTSMSVDDCNFVSSTLRSILEN